MYKNVKQGWYKLVNPHKFVPPIDNHMKSFNESTNEVQYKSSLELNAIKYADFNPHVKRFSLEPFHIKYIKPTDGKEHRYFIDLFLEFRTGDKFIVEVKSKNETTPPQKPKSRTPKAIKRYHDAMTTFAINTAKWNAAREFAKKNDIRFIILTEDELK
jgi:hypothetical protein